MIRAMRSFPYPVLLGLTALLPLACDKPKAEGTPPPSAEPTKAPPPQAPLEKAKPAMALDDTGATVADTRVEFAAPDAKGRLDAVLASHKVAGEAITLDVARDAKTPKVAMVVDAIANAKAASLVIRAGRRDKTTGEIPFVLSPKRADCMAVGFIGKEGAINAWPAGGGTAARFARGMAGPDNTLGSAGIRKVMGACEANTWLVGADEKIPFGLVFDLILAVNGEDGGAARAPNVALVTKPAVPGRRLD